MSSAALAPDRLSVLLSQQAGASWNGIDFVEVANPAQTLLRVHFLTDVAVQGTLDGDQPVTIGGGETITTVAVLAIDEATAWSADDAGRPLLTLSVAAPGDFSTYTLTISSSALDPFFSSVQFSFKAACPSDLDCATASPNAAPDGGEPVAIDYMAKDFASFTRALSDFSALRYPDWVERSEADFGVMMMEALSAIADELSYLQDRVAAEGNLQTATQPLSLLRHARLVDYEPAPATVATTVLSLDVSAGPIQSGLRVSALGADGSEIPFEVGGALADPDSGELQSVAYAVDPRWNRYAADGATPNLVPYWWDASRQVLAAGSTGIWILRHGLGLFVGQSLLLDTPGGETSADPPTRELVELVAVNETSDPVFSVDLTRIDFAAPTSLDHDLATTLIAGNVVPAVQGARSVETFAIPGGEPPPLTPPPAPVVVRTAANWTPQDPRPDYRYTLSVDPLAWIAVASDDQDTPIAAAPEIVLSTVTAGDDSAVWRWQRWLLTSAAADTSFTITPERYSVVGSAAGQVLFDYDGAGSTIRFGDGSFGATPPPGTVFSATYRTGGGSLGNVPADAIARVTPGQPQSTQVLSVTNPFAAVGGADAETAQQIRDRAPQAFQAQPLRVVRSSDYVQAARSLDWVAQAGNTFRWTGSWLTAYTTADPALGEQLTIAQLQQLSDLLDRRRLAGYESYVLSPSYASVDLIVTVCAQASAFAADVQAAVLARLQPGPLPDGTLGFFDHAHWSFGQPLEASALLAAVQRASGVLGVTGAVYRQRGVQPDWIALPQTVAVAADRILRVDNDPSRPEAGSLQVIVEGGR